MAGNARTARVLLLTLIAIVPASRSNAASSDQPDRVSVYVGAASVQQESSDDAKKRASSLGDIRNALKKSDLLVAATDVEHAQVVIELQARDIVLHNPVTVVLKTVGLAGDSGRYTSGTWSHILRMVVRARGRTETLTGQYDQQGPSGPTVNWIDQPWSHAAAGAVRAIESWVETNYLQRAVLVRTDGVYVSTHRGDSDYIKFYLDGSVAAISSREPINQPSVSWARVNRAGGLRPIAWSMRTLSRRWRAVRQSIEAIAEILQWRLG